MYVYVKNKYINKNKKRVKNKRKKINESTHPDHAHFFNTVDNPLPICPVGKNILLLVLKQKDGLW